MGDEYLYPEVHTIDLRVRVLKDPTFHLLRPQLVSLGLQNKRVIEKSW